MVKIELSEVQYELLLNCMVQILAERCCDPNDQRPDHEVQLHRFLRAQCPPNYVIQTEDY
jgi:hypothetical protein